VFPVASRFPFLREPNLVGLWLADIAGAGLGEQLKQLAFVLEYQGAPITEQNIKRILGPKWAWKMDKLFKVVRFEVGD
jgi:hypothetical protein